MHNLLNNTGSKIGIPSSKEEQELSARMTALYGCIVPKITHMPYIDPATGDVTYRAVESVLAELEAKLDTEMTVTL